MARNYVTDEEVEREIEKLNQSPLVALARKESRIKNRRRQYMYQLRTLERRGEELAASGVTMEMLEGMDGDDFGEA